MSALQELVEAEAPPEERGLRRDAVRLLVSHRDGRVEHARFERLPELLRAGDLLVVNTSRTLPAALDVTRAGGAALKLHLSTPVPADPVHWVVELRRGDRRARDGRAGETLLLPNGGRAELVAPYLGSRLWIAALCLPEPLSAYLSRHGRPIRYGHLQGEWPLEEHQAVYATEPGSAEMPSAGRPFTAELITRLMAHGIDLAPLVLHTGVSSLERGERPYPERYRVPRFTAERANLVRGNGGRVIAVGTTVARALESAVDEDGWLRGAGGWTDLVLGPERPARALDGLLTGFHDRDSSHLALLASVAPAKRLEQAYAAGAAAGYTKHEFGDMHLILTAPSRPRGRGSRSAG